MWTIAKTETPVSLSGKRETPTITTVSDKMDKTPTWELNTPASIRYGRREMPVPQHLTRLQHQLPQDCPISCNQTRALWNQTMHWVSIMQLGHYHKLGCFNVFKPWELEVPSFIHQIWQIWKIPPNKSEITSFCLEAATLEQSAKDKPNGQPWNVIPFQGQNLLTFKMLSVSVKNPQETPKTCHPHWKYSQHFTRLP